MEYRVEEAGGLREEIWNEKTVRVHAGGFNLNPSEFPAGEKYAKKGLPLNIDWDTRKVKPVKTAVVASTVGGSDTDIYVKKNHIFKVGDFIGNGTKSASITVIDTSDPDVDKISLSAAIGAQAVNVVLTICEAAGDNKPLRKANGLNYADVEVQGKVHPVASVIYAVDEVHRSRLPYAVSAAMESDLTARFLFIP